MSNKSKIRCGKIVLTIFHDKIETYGIDKTVRIGDKWKNIDQFTLSDLNDINTLINFVNNRRLKILYEVKNDT